jgi:uncharacterized protein (TIGR00369 family)
MDTDEPLDAARLEKVRAIFARAPFVVDLGGALVRAEHGLAESELVLAPRHAQQDGFVHAGVLGTLADHTAGAAAATCVRADQTVLTIEYKLSLLRPARGARLTCSARVLRAGRTVAFVESEVHAHAPGEDAGEGTLVAQASVTLAVVRGDVGMPAPPRSPTAVAEHEERSIRGE